MRIHAIIHGSRVNGPGLRTVVWFQGCTLACPGCHNPATHPTDGGFDITPEALAHKIIAEAPEGTEGITMSGGEPFQQSADLFKFLSAFGSFRPLWSMGVFTGYTMDELAAQRIPMDNVWLDFAVCGRYDFTRPTLDHWYLAPWLRLCSSTNQRLYLLSSRYDYSDFPAPALEVNIDADGLTQITGFTPA
jgi:anaerobic ribonucleoside-triphosphate reductase activating protein